VGKYYVIFENKFREEFKQWLEKPEAKTTAEAWWKGAAGLKIREKMKSALDKANKIKDEAKKKEVLELKRYIKGIGKIMNSISV
jgi:hypothetical protein